VAPHPRILQSWCCSSLLYYWRDLLMSLFTIYYNGEEGRWGEGVTALRYGTPFHIEGQITMYLAAADMASLLQSYSHILNKTENTH
jgi:hypothetical protein